MTRLEFVRSLAQLGWVVALATGVSHAVGAQAEPSPTIAPPASLQAPKQIDRWARVAERSFGRADLGYAYQYKSSDSTDRSIGTLYLYSRAAELRDVSADSVLASGIANFKEVLEVQKRRGEYESYEIALERADTIVIGRDTYPGRMLLYAYKRQGTAGVSLFQLHVVKDDLIKVRISMAAEQFERAGPDHTGDIVDLAHRLAAASVRAPAEHQSAPE